MKIKVINRSRHKLPEYSMMASAGITVLNAPGTIDAGYRGEICITPVNLSNEKFVIKDGERICQMIIAKHENAAWESVDELVESHRGSRGFGHTGKS